MTGDRPLTLAEVASILRVSWMTVRRLVQNGELRAFRFPARTGEFRVWGEDLDAYLDRNVTG